MKTITVFTPTYNRAYILPQLYESLKRQTSQDFCWLLVDDGSTDNTKNLADSWIKERQIEIRYYYQENGGKERAHNYGAKLTETELFMCCDSDDYITDNAIEVILNKWHTYDGDKSNISGIVGPRGVFKNGVKLKNRIPHGWPVMKFGDFCYKSGKIKESFVAMRTELVRQYPYPVQEGERFIPIGYLYRKLDEHYMMLTIEDELMICKYLADGETMNGVKWFVENPKGMALSKNDGARRYGLSKTGLRCAIDYISASLIAKRSFGEIFAGSNTKGLTLLFYPLGYVRKWSLMKRYRKLLS